jgi:hypothetical protein
MNTPSKTPQPRLETRLFGSVLFAVPWCISLALLIRKLWWVRDALLVIWVHGYDAFFVEGLRVLSGKPVRFSNGELAPSVPDFFTGLLFAVVVMFSASFLVVILLRFLERSKLLE